MATKSVLEYVQSTLSAIESDKVDAIADTEESMQVAEFLKDVYDEFINRQDWAFLHRAITLISAADTALPTKMTVAEGVRKVETLWYNVATDGSLNRRELTYLCPKDFLARTAGGASDSRTLCTVDEQIQFYVYNDRMPSYYTSFDDDVVFLDAYDADVETTVTTARITAWGVFIPEFQVADTFVPLLPQNMVPMLQDTLTSTAALRLKQQADLPGEKRVARQLSRLRRKESKLNNEFGSYYANQFGRRR
jgi:hypothetical protein